MSSLTQELARLVVETKFEDLPEAVVHEAKRALLDSIGCALAGIATDKGKISIELARRLGGPPESSIIGTGDKVSCCNAAFANGELINALDYDTILTPSGHTSPNVIPAPLAVAEIVKASGKDLILATVLGHEVSARIACGMERTIGSPAYGYSLCIMGAAVSTGKILKLDHKKMSHALGIAAYACPIPTFAKWETTAPSSMTKYGSSGWVCSGAVTAALLAELGYTGDITALDGEYGLWKFLTTNVWEPNMVVEKIGETWRLPEMKYKFYPSCEAYQGVLDCFTSIINSSNLMPEDIESVKFFFNPELSKAVYQNREIATHIDAQFSGAYLFAAAAHRVKVGPDWQDMNTLRNPKILEFMKKVSFQPSPKTAEERLKDPRSYWCRVEVIAKGKMFSEERMHYKGTPFTEAKATDEELAEKFRHNASRILTEDKIDAAVKSFLELEMMENTAELVKQVAL